MSFADKRTFLYITLERKCLGYKYLIDFGMGQEGFCLIIFLQRIPHLYALQGIQNPDLLFSFSSHRIMPAAQFWSLCHWWNFRIKWGRMWDRSWLCVSGWHSSQVTVCVCVYVSVFPLRALYYFAFWEVMDSSQGA